MMLLGQKKLNIYVNTKFAKTRQNLYVKLSMDDPCNI